MLAEPELSSLHRFKPDNPMHKTTTLFIALSLLGAASAPALTQGFEAFGIAADTFEEGPTPNAVVTETTDPFGPDSGLQITANGIWHTGDAIGFRNIFNEVENPVGTLSYTFWNGVGLSTLVDTTTEGFANEGAAYTGGGANFSGEIVPGGAYGIVFPFFENTSEIALSAYYSLQGMYITNTTYAALAMLNGNGVSRQFEQGDWFQMTITGLDSDENVTGQLFVFLADYRSSNPDDHYILDEWEWIDMSGFGESTANLRFSFYSSDVGEYGINTPTYVAIDNVVLTAKALAGAVPVADGWSYSPWFGDYYDANLPWVYQNDLGWLYLDPQSTPDDITLYSNLLRWAYTTAEAYPWLYVMDEGAWLYYIKGTENPWLFYDADTKEIVEYPHDIDLEIGVAD